MLDHNKWLGSIAGENHQCWYEPNGNLGAETNLSHLTPFRIVSAGRQPPRHFGDTKPGTLASTGKAAMPGVGTVIGTANSYWGHWTDSPIRLFILAFASLTEMVFEFLSVQLVWRGPDG